jgi:hypothetical protein
MSARKEPRSPSCAPCHAHAVAVESPEKGSYEQEDGLVEGPGNGKQA